VCALVESLGLNSTAFSENAVNGEDLMEFEKAARGGNETNYTVGFMITVFHRASLINTPLANTVIP
jgi:hypothetical protein